MEPDERSPVKTLLPLILIPVILTVGIAGFAFFRSRKTLDTDKQPLTTPTPIPTLAVQPSPTISSSPEPTFKPTSTPKPTAKPTATPKPSPTATPTPVTQSTTINSTASLDGFRSSNNGGNDTLDIRAGRNSTLTTRGFITFDLPDSVKGKTIVSAKLRVYQYDIKGAPYTAGGSLTVDSLDYGASLDSADYSASAAISTTATLTNNPTLEWKDADVTTALKADLAAGHARAQFRLRFSTESTGGDVTGDFAHFYSSNAGNTTNRPQLEIKYQ